MKSPVKSVSIDIFRRMLRPPRYGNKDLNVCSFTSSVQLLYTFNTGGDATPPE